MCVGSYGGCRNIGRAVEKKAAGQNFNCPNFSVDPTLPEAEIALARVEAEWRTYRFRRRERS
jgi:hypothetical protein